MSYIIGLSGKAGSGKDTVADMIDEIYESQFIKATGKKLKKEFHTPFEKKRFAERVKIVCSSITGYPIETFYNREKYNQVIPFLGITLREFMQKVGDGLRREVNDKIWVYGTLSHISPNANVMITDERYPNEADGIKEIGGINVRIFRPNYIDPTLDTEEKRNHASETGLDEYDKFDKIFINDGTIDDLRKQVKTWMIDIGLYKRID